MVDFLIPLKFPEEDCPVCSGYAFVARLGRWTTLMLYPVVFLLSAFLSWCVATMCLSVSHESACCAFFLLFVLLSSDEFGRRGGLVGLGWLCCSCYLPCVWPCSPWKGCSLVGWGSLFHCPCSLWSIFFGLSPLLVLGSLGAKFIARLLKEKEAGDLGCHINHLITSAVAHSQVQQYYTVYLDFAFLGSHQTFGSWHEIKSYDFPPTGHEFANDAHWRSCIRHDNDHLCVVIPDVVSFLRRIVISGRSVGPLPWSLLFLLICLSCSCVLLLLCILESSGSPWGWCWLLAQENQQMWSGT